MDYRSLSLDRIGWVDGKAWYGGAGKIIFQTPTCRCVVAPLRKFGPHARTISLMMEEHTDFRQFLERLQDLAAAGNARLVQGLDIVPTASFDGQVRLSSFGDAQWFGLHGEYLEDPFVGSTACACLLQLTGIWLSHDRGSWGLKWRVLECKEMVKTEEDESDAWQFRD